MDRLVRILDSQRTCFFSICALSPCRSSAHLRVFCGSVHPSTAVATASTVVVVSSSANFLPVMRRAAIWDGKVSSTGDARLGVVESHDDVGLPAVDAASSRRASVVGASHGFGSCVLAVRPRNPWMHAGSALDAKTGPGYLCASEGSALGMIWRDASSRRAVERVMLSCACVWVFGKGHGFYAVSESLGG